MSTGNGYVPVVTKARGPVKWSQNSYDTKDLRNTNGFSLECKSKIIKLKKLAV